MKKLFYIIMRVLSELNFCLWFYACIKFHAKPAYLICCIFMLTVFVFGNVLMEMLFYMERKEEKK